MGYPLDIFQDADNAIHEKFICPICMMVLQDAVSAGGCQHLFCRACILQWLDRSNTCPVDRQKLTRLQLERPARYFTEVMGSLKCEYRSADGSRRSVVTLDELDRHKAGCRCPFHKRLPPPPPPPPFERSSASRFASEAADDDYPTHEPPPSRPTADEEQLRELRLQLRTMSKELEALGKKHVRSATANRKLEERMHRKVERLLIKIERLEKKKTG